MDIRIDRNDERPLYIQLADSIREMVLQGSLLPGQRLPTVRALFHETGLSDGTIRHAYEHLAREGVLTLVQGSGTFVSHEPRGNRSKEIRAMAAIDRMLEELEGLGMTLREIQLYINVKMSHRKDSRPLVRLACVDESSEMLNELALQLSTLPGVELTEYLLQDVRRAPIQLLGSFPLVVTTQANHPELLALMGEQREKVLCVALAPEPGTLIALARLPLDSRIGIYCRSKRFREIVLRELALVPGFDVAAVKDVRPKVSAALKDLLQGLDVLLVAPDYLTYADDQSQEQLSCFVKRGGRLIPCRHRLDQGSRMVLEQKILELRG